MDTNELLDLFFNRTFENNINKEMLDYGYDFPYDKVIDYVHLMVNTPLQEFIDKVRSKVYLAIDCKDIPQYSSLGDATSRCCQALAENGDKGFHFEDVGRLLLNDGQERKICAYRKYGENHSKTACQLGLTQNLYNHIYLSALGRVYNMLDESDKKALLARTILRNDLFGRVFSLAEFQDVNIAKFCQSLSLSTIIRRRPNVLQLCGVILDEFQREGRTLGHRIYFTMY